MIRFYCSTHPPMVFGKMKKRKHPYQEIGRSSSRSRRSIDSFTSRAKHCPCFAGPRYVVGSLLLPSNRRLRSLSLSLSLSLTHSLSILLPTRRWPTTGHPPLFSPRFLSATSKERNLGLAEVRSHDVVFDPTHDSPGRFTISLSLSLSPFPLRSQDVQRIVQIPYFYERRAFVTRCRCKLKTPTD